MTKRAKIIWEVDIEASADPYGYGRGDILLVQAQTREGARRIANRHAAKCLDPPGRPGYYCAFEVREALVLR